MCYVTYVGFICLFLVVDNACMLSPFWLFVVLFSLSRSWRLIIFSTMIDIFHEVSYVYSFLLFGLEIFFFPFLFAFLYCEIREEKNAFLIKWMN